MLDVKILQLFGHFFFARFIDPNKTRKINDCTLIAVLSRLVYLDLDRRSDFARKRPKKEVPTAKVN